MARCVVSMIVVALYMLLLTQCASISASNVLISWSNITVVSPKRTILSMPPGDLKKGRLTAIIGPSGCGKSTFLNIIGNKWRRSATTSLTKQSDITSDLRNEDIAFVYQDYSFFAMLTVKETLMLCGHLRRMVSKEEHKVPLRVQIADILGNLSLAEVAGSRVGDPLLQDSRGLSGGERKRLSIGCELLGGPALIVADEPTSGLDCFQAQKVVQILRNIARERDAAVVCSIHQPRYSTWKLFDDVILLSPFGSVCYAGDRVGLDAYFASIGNPIPTDANAAEFLLDLVSLDTTSSTAMEVSMSKIRALEAAYTAKIASRVSAAPIRLHLHSADIKTRHSLSLPVMRIGIGTIRCAGKSLKRLMLLLVRSSRQVLRDNATNIARLAVSAILAAVVGLVNGRQSTSGGVMSVDSVGDRVNIIAQAAINIGMLSTIKTLQLFKKERPIIERERSQEQYTALEYLLAKILAELPLDALVAAAYGYALQAKSNLRCGGHQIARVLSLLAVASSTLGLAVGSLCPSGDSSLAIGPALMVVYVVIGVIGPAGSAGKQLPRFLQPLRDASPFKYACEALTISELMGQPLGPAVEQSPLWPQAALRGLAAAFRRLLPLGPAAGDVALAQLGVRSSFAQATGALRVMICAHTLLALIGLWLH